MAEQLIPETFVNEFFLELVETYKHPKNIKHHEYKQKRPHKVRASVESLSQEAQDIQILEEKPILPPAPMPGFFSHSKDLGAIALPTAPAYQVHVPVLRAPMQNFFDFGRLNAVVNDPNVTLIQCDGPGMQIKINRKNKTEKTSIKLTEREIQAIISKFSQRSQQPITEPVFKAQIMPWQITAVISPVNIRFVIVRK